MTMFSKKHYEAIAQALSDTAPDKEQNSAIYCCELDSWMRVRDKICDLFAGDNSNFLIDKFRNACRAKEDA